MRKLFLICAIAGLSAVSAKAQDMDNGRSSRVSLAANIGAPVTAGYSFAYGVDVQGDFGVAATTYLTLSGGYEGYAWKGGGGSTGIIPLLGGAKFFFGDAHKAYGHAQLGYSFSTRRGGGGAFAYAPSIGYYVSPGFDIALKYLAFSRNGLTTGSLNLRFAYNF